MPCLNFDIPDIPLEKFLIPAEQQANAYAQLHAPNVKKAGKESR